MEDANAVPRNTTILSMLDQEDALCHMEDDENIDTQRVADHFEFDEPTNSNRQAEIMPNCWGMLMRVPAATDWAFPQTTYLEEGVSSYTVGRIKTCSVAYKQVNSHERKTDPHFISISKVHFELVRERLPSGDYVTMIHEKSTNGTFLNGVKLCKPSALLQSNSHIGLASPDNVFLYTEAPQLRGTEKLRKRFQITSKQLGSGAMGTVYLGCKKRGQDWVAVKEIKKIGMDTNDVKHNAEAREKMMREIQVILKVDHPCCLRVFDYDESPTHLYIVTEYCDGGEMFENITDHKYGLKGPGEQLSKFYCYQIIAALTHLHSRNICHRDLKPENVLFVSRSDWSLLKIADFGLAKVVDEQTVLKTMCGTPTYMPPEVLRLRDCDQVLCYDMLCDMWSLGALLFVCLCGFPAFSEDWNDTPHISMNRQILEGLVEMRMKGPNWDKIHKHGKALVLRMLNVNPAKRITAEEALNHAWFKQSTAKKGEVDAVEYAKKVMAQATDNQVHNSQVIQPPVVETGAVRKRPNVEMLVDDRMDTSGNGTPKRMR